MYIGACALIKPNTAFKTCFFVFVCLFFWCCFFVVLFCCFFFCFFFLGGGGEKCVIHQFCNPDTPKFDSAVEPQISHLVKNWNKTSLLANVKFSHGQFR